MEQPGGGVVDAVRITVRDGLYGVVFAHTVPKTVWQGAGPNVLAYDWASYVQELAGHEHVQGIDYAQDTNVNGKLIDVLYVTVGTDDGAHQALATIPFGQLNTPGAFAAVDSVYARLLEVAAMT